MKIRVTAQAPAVKEKRRPVHGISAWSSSLTVYGQGIADIRILEALELSLAAYGQRIGLCGLGGTDQKGTASGRVWQNWGRYLV